MPTVRTNAGTTPQPDPPPTPILREDPPTISRRVIVKFLDEVELPPDSTSRVDANLAVPGWSDWLAVFPKLTNRRLFTQSEAVIDGLLAKAQLQDPSYEPVNLRNYVAVTVPSDEAEPESVFQLIRAHGAVARAYVEPLPGDPPSVNPSNDVESAAQGYLDPAADGGIDARYAWDFPGGDGEGQTLIDVERGWDLSHPDLAGQNIDVSFSGDNYSYKYHGTGVLGVIAAADNTEGCVGIAPNVASIRCASPYRGNDAAGNVIYSVPQAVLDAVEVMTLGQVLLIELQSSIWGKVNLPIEAEPAVFDVIRLATALGIVVVEPAGNGFHNLDTIQDDTLPVGLFVFNTTVAADFRDSGAILVGAADSLSTTPTARHPMSSYGTRVDCFAWGDGVHTLDIASATGYGEPVEHTSAASAIVAGAALVVQGLSMQQRGRLFGGWQLRDLLSNPDHGTRSQTGDKIGVMPNLRLIIGLDVLALAPDIYIRDYVGDTGDPHGEMISASPDVIVRPQAVVDPRLAFGEESGTKNSDTLGSKVEAGQDNFVYVRVQNRGGVDVTGVEATVYWAPSSSLLTPDLWTLVGSTILPSVPKGDVLAVSDAIVWPAAEVPATGHYCFVGLVGHLNDPAPEPAKFRKWANFHRYIRENNNVAWRNFNVVDNVASLSATPLHYVSLPFLIMGAWDELRPMTVEIGGRLPRSASVRLELPRESLEVFRVREAGVSRGRSMPERVELTLSKWAEFREVRLPVGARIEARLLVHVPEALRRHEFEVFARQLYRGEEVGRVTWRLAPRRRA